MLHKLWHNIDAWKTETLTVLPREHSLFPGLETLDGMSSGIRPPFAAAFSKQSLPDYKKQWRHRVCVTSTGARGLVSRKHGANVFAPRHTSGVALSPVSGMRMRMRSATLPRCHAATHHLAAVTLYGFFLVAPRFFSDPSPWFSGCSGNLFVTAGQVSELGGGGGRQDPAVSWSGQITQLQNTLTHVG